MKKFITIGFSFAMLLGCSLTANGQTNRNRAERAVDHHQIKLDKKTIVRDRSEIAQFKGYIKGLTNAINTGNFPMSKGHHLKLVNSMQREVMQGERKIAQAKNEVAQSRSEVHSDNREIRKDKVQHKPVQRVDDVRDRRDDQRDLRDDKNDLAELKRRNARQKEIHAIFKAIKVDNLAQAKKISAKMDLLGEFLTTMKHDMGENLEEHHEDKNELREDREESREDRRQR